MTCPNINIDPSKTDFVAARGVKPEMMSIDKIDIYNVGSYMINGQPGQQLIDLVKKAIKKYIPGFSFSWC